ncbi:MAG: FkbM family methyltransferase [Flavobacteriales bacterium]|nr:FkbM family methyltransferase [Flavobacteriales bacterium]
MSESSWQHLYFQGEFSFNFNGQTLKLINHNSSFETSIFWTGTFHDERASLQIWYALCEHSKNIVDIGANTGVYSIVAKSANPNSNLAAFEPIDRIFSKLEANILLNGMNVTMEKMAASNSNGSTIIYDLPAEHHYHASLVKEEVEHHEGIRAVEVEVIRLDDYLVRKNWSSLDLVKIDVEGFEIEVIEGMKDALQRWQPSILIELKDAERAAKMEAMVASLGYRFYDIDENVGIRQTNGLMASTKWNCLLLNSKHARLLDNSIISFA